MRTRFWLGATVLLALGLATVARADTDVYDCAVLDVPGERYRLAADVSYGGADACFDVAADGIVFDLQYHTVTGGFYPSGWGFQQGIRVTGHGVTVKNGFLVGFTGSFPFSAAVFVDGGNGATLSNLTLSDSRLGVLSYLSEGTRLAQSVVSGSGSAVLLCPSDGVLIDNNQLTQNRVGVEAQCGGAGPSVTSNVLRDNLQVGIRVWNGAVSGARIDSNTVSGSDHGILLDSLQDSTVSNNSTNGNRTAGLRAFWSNGNVFAGNVSSDNSDPEAFAGYGIAIENSCSNVIESNVTDRNLDVGISLFESGDSTVRLNRASYNDTGIGINNFGGDPCGGAPNLATDNSTMRNRIGLRSSESPNTLTHNTSLRNELLDVLGDCTATTWIDNKFKTASDPCID